MVPIVDLGPEADRAHIAAAVTVGLERGAQGFRPSCRVRCGEERVRGAGVGAQQMSDIPPIHLVARGAGTPSSSGTP